MDLLDLYAKITLDDSEYKKGIDSAEKSSGKFASVLKSGIVAGAKVAAATIGTLVTGIASLTTAAIQGYAEYEQLAGGVETLFGSGGKSLEEYAASVGKAVDDVRSEYSRLMVAEQDVFLNASNAFKTAGMSANEYMETVTSFSASLIQSLGGDTAEAARVADMAIIDMSDNANKMGTDMEAIQNAYQGFAKQNYTMLDNLDKMGASAA